MSDTALAVPGDKSIAHRALILATLARGASILRNVPDGGDVASTARVLRDLGATIFEEEDAVRIDSTGSGAFDLRGQTLDCGNSGTTARLVMGVAAALPGSVVLDGDASLRRRPMARVVDPLREAGARIEYLRDPGTLPVRVCGGSLRRIRHAPPVASAQVKSSLLLAGLVAGVPVELEEAGPSRDHTERMLRAMGARLLGRGRTLRLEPGPDLAPLRIDIPGDFSSAAFLVAAALLGGVRTRIGATGVNPTRTGLLDVLDRMGAAVTIERPRTEYGEPVGDVVVRPSALRACRVDGELVVRTIDELPLVAALAAHARGTTEVRDATELRTKESDRIQAVCANLIALGVDADERPDGFRVTGTDRPLTGSVRSFGDHRIAMAFAVLGTRPGSRIEIDDRAIAAVSFPGFDHALRAIGRGGPLSSSETS